MPQIFTSDDKELEQHLDFTRSEDAFSIGLRSPLILEPVLHTFEHEVSHFNPSAQTRAAGMIQARWIEFSLGSKGYSLTLPEDPFLIRPNVLKSTAKTIHEEALKTVEKVQREVIEKENKTINDEARKRHPQEEKVVICLEQGLQQNFDKFTGKIPSHKSFQVTISCGGHSRSNNLSFSSIHSEALNGKLLPEFVLINYLGLGSLNVSSYIPKEYCVYVDVQCELDKKPYQVLQIRSSRCWIN